MPGNKNEEKTENPVKHLGAEYEESNLWKKVNEENRKMKEEGAKNPKWYNNLWEKMKKAPGAFGDSINKSATNTIRACVSVVQIIAESAKLLWKVFFRKIQNGTYYVQNSKEQENSAKKLSLIEKPAVLDCQRIAEHEKQYENQSGDQQLDCSAQLNVNMLAGSQNNNVNVLNNTPAVLDINRVAAANVNTPILTADGIAHNVIQESAQYLQALKPKDNSQEITETVRQLRKAQTQIRERNKQQRQEAERQGNQRKNKGMGKGK